MSCSAQNEKGTMVCRRCGFAWPEAEAAPSCRPITFEDLRLRMLSECSSAETSLRVVEEIRAAGTLPADPRAARRRLAELEAVHRLVDRCVTTAAIRDLLKGAT